MINIKLGLKILLVLFLWVFSIVVFIGTLQSTLVASTLGLVFFIMSSLYSYYEFELLLKGGNNE